MHTGFRNAVKAELLLDRGDVGAAVELLKMADESVTARKELWWLAEIRRLEDVRRAAALFRSHPSLAAPADFAAAVRKLVEAPLPSPPTR